ncbi:MAG: fibro-slime domain-containing protein [Minicystis sp.]
MALRSLSFLVFSLLAIGSVACSAGGGGRASGSDSAGSGAGSGGGGITGSGAGTGGINITVGPGAGSGAGGDDCGSTLDVTYRDFNESHPDFERPFAGDVVRLQLIQPNLGADSTPVFRDSVGCPQDPNKPDSCANWVPQQPVITSADTFNQWYHTVDGVNLKFAKTLKLEEDMPGSGNYVFDSPNFFPLGPNEGFGITPKGNPQGQNFLFTTEIHVNFKYVAGQVFTFRGDDDLWIFVNNKLALDLGSTHAAVQGTINFDAQAAALGISPGGSYPMDIFQAERHTSASDFRFETNISCFTPGPVPK